MSANDFDEVTVATTPIGERLRLKRVEVLGKGLREMAGLLSIAPAHLTDIEKGRRTPSEELMLRIAERYKMPIAELRAAWSRPDQIVGEVANQDATTATKVPEFLRTARNLTPEQWDKMIAQAKKLAGEKGRGV
ncbi:MAG: helix-turn-helix transcriptional regulator [Tepidisphaeraceae bacterium]